MLVFQAFRVHPPLPLASASAILAIVAREQPVAACMMALQDWPAFSMLAMPALRSVSSGRPLYRACLKRGT